MFCNPTPAGKLLGFVTSTMAELGMVCAPGFHNQAEHDRIAEMTVQNQGQKVAVTYQHEIPYQGSMEETVRALEVQSLDIARVISRAQGELIDTTMVSDRETRNRTVTRRVEYTIHKHEADFDEKGCCKAPEAFKGVLYSSNLEYIYQNNHNKYEGRYKDLPQVDGYSQDKGQYDRQIQFWLFYFQDQGLFPEGVDEIDPLLLKVQIAKESSFDPNAESSKSSASGLMQLLSPTRNMLAGRRDDDNTYNFNRDKRQEIKTVKIDLGDTPCGCGSEDSLCNSRCAEVKNVNANIAGGIRWVLYKMNNSPCTRTPRNRNNWSTNQKLICVGDSRSDRIVRGGFAGYFSFNEEGNDYVNNIFEIYENSNVVSVKEEQE